MKLKFTLLWAFLMLSTAQSLFAIDADIVVAQDGSGDFTTLQAAINAVPSNQSDRRTVIFIKNGLYNTEKLLIPSNKLNVTLIGESRDQTIISYHIYDCESPASGNKCPAEDAVLWTGDVIRTSATLTIMGAGFRAENLTIQNTAGPVGQALAITVQADKTVFVNCNILGYQDTIYLWTSGKRSYFKNCLVLGRTDYIYGAGIGFFDACEIRSFGGGYITAPSTPKSQAYGFVFSHCDITYTDGSPQPTNDGQKFRLGRPWHEYPKVAWLYCDMSGMINPEGWGDTWNMEYAATSTDLHLYEYMNTGAGADMSGRADWAGLRALTDEEANAYTAAAVLNGNDGWSPYEDEPLATTYEWDGGGADKSWMTAENWNPDGTPASAEVANVSGAVTVNANGGNFGADLNLKDGAELTITANSTVAYLAVEDGIISATSDVTLSGKIATKDTVIITTNANLTIDATLTGIHNIVKRGSGTLILTADNTDFSGAFIVEEGTLDAQSENSLGKAAVVVKSGSTLKVENDAAFFPESSLSVVPNATLDLSATVTLSEFYINGVLQAVGSYTAATNPSIISGTGSVVVGRPDTFLFSGGPWDNAANYTPALLPEEGETVLCEGEMETASTTNIANVIFVKNKGKLRLRGQHKSTGTLTFEGNQRISYATSGPGFALEAPIIIQDDINFEMSSGNADGSVMDLSGSIVGDATVTIKNTQSTTPNASYVLLHGNNSGFSGVWDLTTAPRNADGSTGIVGAGADAFGTAKIIAGNKNYIQFDHAECTSTANTVILNTGSKAIVNADVIVGSLTLGNTTYSSGVFTATTNPEFIEGSGSITLEANALQQPMLSPFTGHYKNGQIFIHGSASEVRIITMDGKLIHQKRITNNTADVMLHSGVYLLMNENNEVFKLAVTK
ncbi:pectinesterase family protein [Saccharicrinis sp. FJH54]|uniref:pectinesterase family protein n=1 Tax=Saccharicrinis sp. FJH54 TaxID=3344665 RepID=UPI0035D4701E